MNTGNEPSHPPTNRPTHQTTPGRYPIDSDPIHEPQGNISAAAWVGIVVAVLVVIALVAAHLTGVIGPGTH